MLLLRKIMRQYSEFAEIHWFSSFRFPLFFLPPNQKWFQFLSMRKAPRGIRVFYMRPSSWISTIAYNLQDFQAKSGPIEVLTRILIFCQGHKSVWIWSWFLVIWRFNFHLPLNEISHDNSLVLGMVCYRGECLGIDSVQELSHRW